MKKIIKTAGFLFLFSSVLWQAAAETKIQFEFSQKKGESSEHVSTVVEEAYLNGYLHNKVEFVNRTTTTVLEADKKGKALLETHYMTTENYLIANSGHHLTWGEEDQVTIYRDKYGELSDPDNKFLPTVQNVPVFPKYKVKKGESWVGDGKEVHDLRALFQMRCAVEIPFTATYTYSDDITIDNKKLNIIDCEYEFFQDASEYPEYKGSLYAGSTGYAKQKIYWDAKKGDIDHYTEEFYIQMADIYGNVYAFSSTAHGEVIGYKSVNDDENLMKLQKEFGDLNLEDVTVQKGEKGLTISLENIQFEADSDKLRASEKTKLRKIAEILAQYNNDLLITGHCAERGTVGARQKLSEDRAEAVADYLEALGVRDEYHIFTEGKGSTVPIASNATEEGRAKNRRVEITIMD